MSRRAVSAAWRGGGVVALILFMQTVCQFFGIIFVHANNVPKLSLAGFMPIFWH
jgi:hypothetical protein